VPSGQTFDIGSLLRTKLPNEWAHVLSCHDYNVLGERCPFSIAHGGKCAFFGIANPTSFPESGVCDKHPEMSSPNKTRLVVQDEVTFDPKLRKSQEYRLWLGSYLHYKRTPEERHASEVADLYKHACMGSYHPVSKRDFNKATKPQGKHLRPGEDPSFRRRAMAAMESLKGYSKPEYVVLAPEHEVGSFTHEDGIVEDFDEWHAGLLSRSPMFRYELDQSGLSAFEGVGLMDLLQKYEGQKILLKWSWWASRDYWGEYDSGIDYVELVRVL